MAEAELDMIQEMKERVKIMFDEGMAFKNQGMDIEALKKFDEVQLMIKQDGGDSAQE